MKSFASSFVLAVLESTARMGISVFTVCSMGQWILFYNLSISSSFMWSQGALMIAWTIKPLIEIILEDYKEGKETVKT